MKESSERDVTIACRLLELYEVSDSVSPREVSGFRVYQSTRYGRQHVYRFWYDDRLFYASDDPSLGDSPRLIREAIEELDPFLTGHLHKDPVLQEDGSAYGCAIDGVVYYLWESHGD